MNDREKVIKALSICVPETQEDSKLECSDCPYGNVCNPNDIVGITLPLIWDIRALLKGQEKKQIKLQKKHVITWNWNDELSMRKLYEAICETLLDEGELLIERTDNHEKVEFVFYVAEGR